MGYGFITRRGGGGYAEGDVISSEKVQAVYEDSVNYTDETRIVSNIEGATTSNYNLYVNPNGKCLYFIYMYKDTTNYYLNVYSNSGTLISLISDSSIRSTTKFKFDSDGNAYYQYGSKIKKISSNGIVSDFITLTSSNTLWEWAGNVLYTVTHGSTSDGFRKYNQAGEMISEKSMNFSYLSQMVTDTNGNFYVAPNETYDNITKYSSEGTQIATTYSGYTTISMLWVSNYLYLIRYDNSNYEVVRCPDNLSSDTTMGTYTSLSKLPNVIKATTIAETIYLFIVFTTDLEGFRLQNLNYNVIADYTASYGLRGGYRTPDVGANGEIFYCPQSNSISKLHTSITGYKVLSDN